MRDDLGDRMKRDYEFRTRGHLPRRTYTLIRIDGRTFHTYTRGLERPFDAGLSEDMDRTAIALCQSLSGCAFAYVQSDEISLLLTDFATPQTQAWFDGNIQKIVSVSASIATAAFNRARWERQEREPSALSARLSHRSPQMDACFDARVFSIPDAVEVENYFLWRQQDALRNSVSMAAHAHYAPEKLHGQSVERMQALLREQGICWEDYPAGYRHGRVVLRRLLRKRATYTHRQTGREHTIEVERAEWGIETPPVFTVDRAYLASRIPSYS